jgi:hypothetical protein
VSAGPAQVWPEEERRCKTGKHRFDLEGSRRGDMEATHTQVTAPEGAPTGSRPVRILAAAAVSKVVRERGGSLYLWTDVHGVCEGKVTLLQADTERPSEEGLHFESIGGDGLDVFLAIGSLLWPEFVELELHGRKKQIRAYWNGQAAVG